MGKMTAKQHKAMVLEELLSKLIAESNVEPAGDLTFNEVRELIETMIAEVKPKPEPDYREMFQSLDRGSRR